MRYWDLCAPCHVDYDFIGTAENYSKEAELFVRQANISVTFPEHEQKTTRESSLGTVLMRMFYESRTTRWSLSYKLYGVYCLTLKNRPFNMVHAVLPIYDIIQLYGPYNMDHMKWSIR